MKTINYKYTTLILAFALIITYAWHWNAIVGHMSGNMNMSGMNMNGMNMDKMGNDSMMPGMNHSMGSSMDNMMAGLEGKTGDAFDKAFIEEMVVHHQGAVDMAQAALKNGKHQELLTLATAIIKAQNKEIADMKAWYKSWYGTPLK